MFKRYLVISLFLWLILVCGCFGLLYSSSSRSKVVYQQLMKESDQVKKERLEEEVRPVQQTRYHVSKQILYKRGPHRMQSRLASDSSHLIYSKKEGELIEQFKILNCTLQEKIFPISTGEVSNPREENTQQVIRCFQAKEALYSYKTGQLEAKEAEVAHYLLPGNRWPYSFDQASPLLQGKAQIIHLSLFKEPALKAQGFQAIFHQWENE